jgi:hypothetical protein
MDQSVMVFGGTAARSSAIPTPSEGMMSYRTDDDVVEVFNGTDYVSVGGVSPVTVDYIVIGGAGGGSNDAFNSGAGGRSGGGGGAGGYRSSISGESSGGGGTAEPSLTLYKDIAYPLFIGAGGAGAAASTTICNRGSNGSPSQFAFINSFGGGAGGIFDSQANAGQNTTAQLGASGGGGGHSGPSLYGGLAIANQGFAGGNGSNTGNFPGGGGGGAGSAGGAGTSTVGGAGGNGVSSTITGGTVIRAGGGPGCRADNDTVGASQGGAGATIGANGTANTGGGGAAGDNTSSGGGDGGSGVILFRIPVANTATFTGGVSQTSATVGSDKVFTVTASGPTDTVTIT